ncbi:MAG: DUF429 domain-containing protein [Gemmatimonadales bacterium]
MAIYKYLYERANDGLATARRHATRDSEAAPVSGNHLRAMPIKSLKIQRWNDILAVLLSYRYPITLAQLIEGVPAYQLGDEKSESRRREVYPAATLRAHGIEPGQYKRVSEMADRQDLLRRLGARVTLPSDLQVVERSADALDAIVWLLVEPMSWKGVRFRQATSKAPGRKVGSRLRCRAHR